MKKAYQTPATAVLKISLHGLLMASGVSSDKGIGYGGVDEEGTQDPSARRRRDSQWDEDEEEQW